MKVLVTGATGFIGRALSARLLARGHSVRAFVRDATRARAVLGEDVELSERGAGFAAALLGVDAVINLAGEPVLGGRFGAAHRARLRESRVDLTAELVAAIGKMTTRPKVLVSASAIGFYGDSGDRVVDEDSPPAEDFLARLCVDWEAAARPAEAFGVRVALIRVGIVLGREGGALGKLMPIFRARLGGPVGRGTQYQAWIHLEDVVALFVCALEDERYRGVFNGTAPVPVRQREFARALGQAVGRYAVLPVPALAVRIAFGPAAGTLLSGQDARPRRALEVGFSFRFDRVEAALNDLANARDVRIEPVRAYPPVSYLETRRPRYLLEQETWIEAELADVFPYFSKAQNLGALTPPGLGFEIRTALEPMRAGLRIDYRITLGPIPMTWQTSIETWEPGRRFVDAQLRGPYRAWWHEHEFFAEGGRTRMVDRVFYAPPLGPLGAIAQQLFVGPMLRRIFAYRADMIAFRFAARSRGTPLETPGLRSNTPI